MTHHHSPLPCIALLPSLPLQFSKDRPPTSCCLALAGPVSSNRCVITNLNWDISGSTISSTLQIPHVSLINDFVAAGYGCLALPPTSLHPLYTPPSNSTPPPPHSVKAIIGAGTGLGEAFAVYHPDLGQYEVYPTEGGHADFGPQTEEEWKVAADIMKRLSLQHCSVERLVSGSGIPNIYKALRSLHPQLVQPAVDEAVLKGDPAANITQHAKAGTDELCVRTIRTFVKLYGAEVGNQALRCIPAGGIYIAGGVAGKMRWAVEGPHFKEPATSTRAEADAGGGGHPHLPGAGRGGTAGRQDSGAATAEAAPGPQRAGADQGQTVRRGQRGEARHRMRRRCLLECMQRRIEKSRAHARASYSAAHPPHTGLVRCPLAGCGHSPPHCHGCV